MLDGEVPLLYERRLLFRMKNPRRRPNRQCSGVALMKLHRWTRLEHVSAEAIRGDRIQRIRGQDYRIGERRCKGCVLQITQRYIRVIDPGAATDYRSG